jgi:hypothetical protein
MEVPGFEPGFLSRLAQGLLLMVEITVDTLSEMP